MNSQDPIHDEETPEKHIGWITKVAAYWATKFREPVQDSEYFADAWIGFLRAKKNFKPELGYAFLTYANKVILSEIIKGIRTRTKYRTLPDGNRIQVRQITDLESAKLEDFRAGSNEELVCTADLIPLLKASIEMLPPIDKAVIQMRMQGMMLREVATELSLSKNRIHQIEQRAHGLLRRLLDRNGHTDDDTEADERLRQRFRRLHQTQQQNRHARR